MMPQASFAAPYTPATVKRIRERADKSTDLVLAAELGWTVVFLKGIARKHDIDLIAASPDVAERPKPLLTLVPKVEIVRRSAPPQPGLSPRLVGSRYCGPVQDRDPAPIALLAFDPLTGVVARKGIGVVLDPRYRPVFEALVLAHCAEPARFVPTGHFDMDASRISRLMRDITEALVPLHMGVVSRYGRGYRLVDLLAQQKEAAE